MDCIGCRACEIACKDKNGLAAGPRFRRVIYVEGGVYPDVFAYKINLSRNHCAEPAHLPACPTGAIYKRKDNGIVDIDSTLCIGCRRCEELWDLLAQILAEPRPTPEEIEQRMKPARTAPLAPSTFTPGQGPAW